MLTAAYSGKHTMTVAEVDAAPPQPDEVQIAVAYVGLCGTDLHIYHGHMDARVDTPAVIGHEMSGTIIEVGDDVKDWSVGDQVTVMPLDWDDTCSACLAGHQHICQNLDFIGIDSPGALQGRWNVNASTLVSLPSDVSLRSAALVEPAAVAVHDVRRSELVAGDKAVVLGGGPIGLLIAVVARAEGADVLIAEVDASRRQLAADLGFEVMNPVDVDQVALVERWTDGVGADIVFEVSGAAAAVLGCTGLAKVRGTIVIVAIHPQPAPIDLQRVFWRELRILGARVYQRTDFERAVELIASGVVPVEALISTVEPIAATADAFAALADGGSMKILIDVQAGA